MLTFLAPLGYVLALAVCILAYMFWRKILTFQESLKKALNENEILAQEQKKLSWDLTQAQTLKKEYEAKVVRLEKDYQGAIEQMRKAQEEVEKTMLAWQLKTGKLQNELEKYKEEARALTTQLVEMDQEKRIIKKDLTKKDDQYKKVLSEEKDKIWSEEKEKRKILEEKIKELENFKNSVKMTASPEEVLMLKKKNRDYFYFYKTIRLQKEMLEERNANWETAMMSLAQWVYEKESPGQTPPVVLGELISGALTLAKKPHLVQDDQ